MLLQVETDPTIAQHWTESQKSTTVIQAVSFAALKYSYHQDIWPMPISYTTYTSLFIIIIILFSTSPLYYIQLVIPICLTMHLFFLLIKQCLRQAIRP